MSADIQGAYLNAPCKERMHTICGPEFGRELKGRTAIIVKALYGLKTSAYAWRSHLAETLRDLGYESCVADNDVWMRKASKPDGFEYYEYVLVYTDDILSVSHQPSEVLIKLDQHYILKRIQLDLQSNILVHKSAITFYQTIQPNRGGTSHLRNT
jgi:Reverse transcriptase (RNA-dependent DNA polymerase)